MYSLARFGYWLVSLAAKRDPEVSYRAWKDHYKEQFDEWANGI
jgi:hypothetical protein